MQIVNTGSKNKKKTRFRLPIALFLPEQAFRRLPRAGESPLHPRATFTIYGNHQGSLKRHSHSTPFSRRQTERKPNASSIRNLSQAMPNQRCG
ncbi:hypothetical protein [Kingella sp. (in: b-proteobacteria)]|uniref:hypothetical protein n=1 Tax=Kingella sp. (in: b-proteobacteria) TaxID=2020713 RepID=UPI0026DBDE64|nr:hypothetical protein [Kingella sp. (in: b-proteobacteria)]